MRVLICPSAFSGALTAVQAAEAMAQGWRRRAPGDSLTLAPLSSGGSGFLDVVTAALGGITVSVTVTDPLGRPVPAAVLLSDAGGLRTAYIEVAQACGLHLLAGHERNPGRASSLGVGQLLDVALTEGAQRIVVGLGGSAVNDGGAGLLAALGIGDPALLAAGGYRLRRLPTDALVGLHEAKARLRGVDLVLATESQAPLLGRQGPSAATACGKGATVAESAALDEALAHFTEVAEFAVPPAKDLFTGLDRKLDREPAAGASGGIGYALYLLGGRRQSIVELVLEAWRFDDLLAAHDLVFTGTGKLDFEAMTGGVLSGVAAAAGRHALATVVVAGEVLVGRREVMALGVAGAYALADSRETKASLAADPVTVLGERCARLAATWSAGGG